MSLQPEENSGWGSLGAWPAGVGALVVIGLCGGVVWVTHPGRFSPPAGAVPPPAQAKAAPPIEAEASELYTLYDDNQAAADLRLLGKTVEVKGHFLTTHKDAKGYRVDLVTADGPRVTNGDVGCYFGSDQLAEIASLKSNDAVVIRGVCEGRFASPDTGTWKGWRVYLGKCKLLKITRP